MVHTSATLHKSNSFSNRLLIFSSFHTVPFGHAKIELSGSVDDLFSMTEVNLLEPPWDIFLSIDFWVQHGTFLATCMSWRLGGCSQEYARATHISQGFGNALKHSNIIEWMCLLLHAWAKQCPWCLKKRAHLNGIKLDYFPRESHEGNKTVSNCIFSCGCLQLLCLPQHATVNQLCKWTGWWEIIPTYKRTQTQACPREGLLTCKKITQMLSREES